MSDLHLEHYKDHGAELIGRLNSSGVDALILAGDITSAQDIQTWRDDLSQFVDIYGKVFYVPGNHEYYGAWAQETLYAMRVAADSFGNELTLLDRTSGPVLFKGQRFIGGTMWFRQRPDDWRWANHLNDFTLIKSFVPWVYDENRATLEYFQDQMRQDDVVVTHHMPSSKSTPPRFANSEINRFFVCEMEGIMMDKKPKFWFHGHTHDSCDYAIESTRVVSYPQGYPNEKFKRGEYKPLEVEV